MKFTRKKIVFIAIIAIGLIIFLKQYFFFNPFSLNSDLAEYAIEYQPEYQYLLDFNKYLINIKHININVEEWAQDPTRFHYFSQAKDSEYAYTYQYDPELKTLTITIGFTRESINQENLNIILNNIITALIFQINENPSQKIDTLNKNLNEKHIDYKNKIVNEIEPAKYNNVNFK